MYDYDINLQVSSHIEAVLLLTKLNVERHIEVDVSMDELDVTAAESKATYNEIRDYVWERYQLKVSNLYIAQVKQKYGIIERENYHKAKNENAKQPKCPKEKEDAIVEALKHFQMAELFQRDKSTISRHIKNIFAEGELERDSVVAKFATTAADGKTYQSNSTILTSLFLLVIVSNPNEAHSSVSGNWHPEGIYAQGICAG